MKKITSYLVSFLVLSAGWFLIKSKNTDKNKNSNDSKNTEKIAGIGGDFFINTETPYFTPYRAVDDDGYIYNLLGDEIYTPLTALGDRLGFVNNMGGDNNTNNSYNGFPNYVIELDGDKFNNDVAFTRAFSPIVYAPKVEQVEIKPSKKNEEKTLLNKAYKASREPSKIISPKPTNFSFSDGNGFQAPKVWN